MLLFLERENDEVDKPENKLPLCLCDDGGCPSSPACSLRACRFGDGALADDGEEDKGGDEA